MDLDWTMFFNGWGPILRTCILGTLAYVAVVIFLRASGKRTLSKMNAFDFVITIALGSAFASILTSQNVSLAQGAAALGLMISLQWINAFVAAHWSPYEKLLKSQPTLLVYRGVFLERAMRQQRVTRTEILASAREQGISDPRQIDAVVLETEGSLSVIREGEGGSESLKGMGVPLPDQSG